MRLGKTSLHGLLGAIILSAGIAAPMANAADGTDEETVDVRIKMPDGSTVIQKAPKNAARHAPSPTRRSAKRLADGSRVSVGSSGVSGSRRSSGARSATRSSSSSSAQSGSDRGGVVVRTGPASQEMGGHDGPEQSPATNDSVESALNVPTIGGAQITGNDAFGGQSVSFKDIKMYGAVIGNNLYLIGVDVVCVDQEFATVRGTRIGADLAMKDQSVDLDSVTDEARFDGKTPLKLSFESDTVVSIVMYSDSGENGSPREERTWTVRIR